MLFEIASDTAERMGVDPASVALAAIVSCAAVMSDDWEVQPKRFDYSWTENPRLWGALVGGPSVMKSPIISICTKPIDKLEAESQRRYSEALRLYKQRQTESKKDTTGFLPEPTAPKRDRYLIENATIEAITEALRDDDAATQRAPARKVLSRQDEMSEYFGNLDRYKAGGKGGGDRGAYLRLYNGGPFSVDRIGRGAFRVPNWSACFLGGIQPEPIQKIANDTVDDGLLQRFLFIVAGHQSPGLDRAPNAAAQDRYDNLFPALTALHPARTADGAYPQVVKLHQDAQQHREKVESAARIMELMPDASSHLQSAFGKWPGSFARVALTFHLIEIADARARGGPQPYLMVLSEETAKKAAAFMLDIAMPHLLRAHALMYKTPQTGHARWIAGFILSKRLERVTTRDVVQAYLALRAPETRDELADVMTNLVTVGWLEPEIPSNSAKPINSWMVNPTVHSLFAEKAERERTRRETAKAQIIAHVAALKGPGS